MADELTFEEELEAYNQSTRARLQQTQETLEAQREVPTPSTFVPTPDIEEARAAFQQAEETLAEGMKTRAKWMLDHKEALALRTGTEVVGGMGLQYAVAKSWPTVKTFLQGTRAASMLGFAGPQAAEPASTVTGVLGFLGSEALLKAGPWVLSNLGGQYVGKEIGLDETEDYSAWEAVGAGLFSLSRVEKLVDGTLKLGVPTAAWANKKMIVSNIGKTTVSGAVLGATEQAFVDAMESMFNGRDKDIYEYIFAAGMGGTFKSGMQGIHGLAASRWGRGKISEAAVLAEKNIQEKLVDIKRQREELKKPSDKGISSGVGWGTWSQFKKLDDELAKKESDLELQIQLIKDTQKGLKAYNDTETLLEKEGYPEKPIEEDIAQAELKTKEAFDAVNETAKVEPELEAPVAEGSAQPVKTDDIETELETPKVVDEAPARTRYVDDTRESQLDTLRKRFNQIKPSDEGATIEVEKVSNLSTTLIDETNLKLQALEEKLHKAFDDGTEFDADTVQQALNEVKFLQEIYKTTDQHDAYLGRGLRARDRNVSEKDHSIKQFSDAADERRAVLLNLENALNSKLQGAQHNELVIKLHEDYLGLKDKQKAVGEELRKKRKERFKKLTETEQQELLEPKEIDEAKAQATRIDRLEKQLQEEQEIFVGEKERPTPKEPVEPSLKEKDLQARLKFYRTDSRESKEIAGLEEKLDRLFKLLDEGDVEKIRQEVGPAPDWAKPEKVNGYLQTLRSVVKKTETDLKQKVTEADLSLQDPDQIVSTVQKELLKLNLRLNELRKRFGDLDAIKKIPKEQTELDPEIVEVKRQIEFYKKAEQDALRLQAKYKERARLLDKETAPLGEQREFVTPKPEGPVRVKSKEEVALDEDIRFLRKNIKDRVNEIDQAAKDIDPVEQARRLQRQYEAEEVRLNKELDDYRAKWLAVNEMEAQATGKKKKIEDDPTFKAKKDQIKFYKKAINEVPKLLKVEQEIAKLSDIKGRAIVGEIRAEVEAKPKGPEVQTALNIKQKERAAIKADLRKTIKELEKANKEIIKQKADHDIINYLIKRDEIERNQSSTSRLKRFADWHLRVRKQSFLFQLGSVLSGVPSAGIQWVQAVSFAPLTRFFYDSISNKSISVGLQLAKYDFMASAKAWSDFNQIKRAVSKTYKDGRSATDTKANRMSSSNYERTLKHLQQSSKIKIRKQQLAQKSLKDMFKKIMDGDLVALGHLVERGLSHSYKAMGSVDEFFRNPYKLQKLWSESLKDAYFEVRERGIKDTKLEQKAVEARAKEIFESRTKVVDGVRMLTEEANLREEQILTDDAFFYAADTNKIEEIHTSFVNQAIESIEKLAGKNAIVEYFFKNRAPFVPMALRGMWRGTKVLSYAGSLGLVGGTRATVLNPYLKKIKNYEKNIVRDKALLTDKADILDDNQKAQLHKNIEQNNKRIQDAKVRQHIYAQEQIATSMTGIAVLATSVAAAWNGMLTGSMAWLDKEQRERLGWLKGKEPYSLTGFDYKYWEPIKHAMAIFADMTTWLKIKALEERTGEKYLREDQDWFNVFWKSLAQIQKDSPLNLGLSDTFDYLVQNPEERPRLGARAISEQIPIPAVAKKAWRRLSTGGKIVDLKGGDFQDKLLYYLIGEGGVNFERDAFGLEKVSTSNWATDLVRIWKKDNKTNEDIPLKVQDVFLTDNRKYKQLKSELPKTFFDNNIIMSDYTDDSGRHFQNEFGKRLDKTFKINNRTLLEQFTYRVYEDTNWATKYKKEEYDERDETKLPTNSGLRVLAEDQRKYYNRLTKELLRDEDTLRRFKNAEGESLYDTVQRFKQLDKIKVKRTKEPLPLSEALGF